MVATQLDRLKSDLHKIEAFVQELREEGREDLSKKVWSKRDYLKQYIEAYST